MFLFCYELLCANSSFAIILKRKRKLVASLLLSYRCIVTINVLWLFLTVPWVDLQCVIVVLRIVDPYFFSIPDNSVFPLPGYLPFLSYTPLIKIR